MKHIILYLMAFCAITQVMAQKLTTANPTYDCGQVMFRNPVTTKFVLRNKSSKQAVIKNIETSCGCATAVASRATVPGGKELVVDATYDAKQLGHFQKEIWIYEEGQDRPLVLTVKGVVVPEILDFSGSYPYMLGDISTDINEIEFDDVSKGAQPTVTMHIRNTTGSTIEPVVMHLPDYLEANVSPTRLRPNQAGTVTFMLLSSKLRDMGLTQTSLYLGKKPGDKVSAEKEIPVSAILTPAFPTQDAAIIANAPQLKLSKTAIRTSEMHGKPSKLKTEIVLKNTGKQQLVISSLQMFTAGMNVSLKKTKIEPGETTKLKITVDGITIKQLKQRPRILMITNDPQQPKVIIELKD
ncbi:MAG: DUF1573 domain-containing protein [Bacteroidales bacterium]|nr:DUF1573 domain-containing protein [Bacteroidales bacterium]MCM1147389.1 DUF1573 domain-containing protein [Bacteroidales bacterium]MCM1207176.1 DUF1573 domain-containing protein [Bacillota bacterium]MCM1510409.1 DUF1573 domain-containing protein [Clostridium sp.]